MKKGTTLTLKTKTHTISSIPYIDSLPYKVGYRHGFSGRIKTAFKRLHLSTHDSKKNIEISRIEGMELRCSSHQKGEEGSSHIGADGEPKRRNWRRENLG